MRAAFTVTVAGTNITTALLPVLLSLRVADKVGTHTDSADLEIDDTSSQIVLPRKGAKVAISLGWQGQGLREVFRGTVDEVKSSGSRGAGRRLRISAKGMDTTGPAKEGQQRHWDEATVETILRDAARFAEVANVQIDPALRTLSRSYFEMRDESFAAMGERLAREIGANFRIVDDTVILSRRNADYTAAVRAAWGDNLHSWDIAPQLGRPQFSGVRARWYDVEKTGWQVVERATGLDVRAVHSGRLSLAGPTEAVQQTDSDAATAERDAGEGSVVIEGNTAAIPDGLCIVSGTRPGVDGAYRIEAVTHTLSRAGGFVTALDLKQPRGGAGADPREATTPTVARAEAAPSTPPIVDPDVSGPQ